MTNPNLTPAPSPEFVAELQSRLVSEKRRLRTFPPEPVRRRIALSTVAVLFLGAIGLGAGGAVAVETVQSTRRTELLVAQERIRLEFEVRRLELEEEQLERIQVRVEQGLAPRAETEPVLARRDAAACELALAESRLREVQASGLPSNDALSAPLVGGHDFVNERLLARLKAAQLQVESAERVVTMARARVDEGLAPAAALYEPTARRDDAAAELERQSRLRSLRERFLSGEVSAERIELIALREQARVNLERATGRLTQVELNLERRQLRVEMGDLPLSELDVDRRARLEALQAVELSTLELELLEEALAE